MKNRITNVGAAAGGCNNTIVTTSSQTIAKPDVSRRSETIKNFGKILDIMNRYKEEVDNGIYDHQEAMIEEIIFLFTIVPNGSYEQGLLAVNEFEKQKYMTEVQKRFEADAYKQKMNYAGSAGIAAEQGFLAGMDRCLHLLQQTPCTAQLPPVDELIQLIEKECAEHITTDGLRFYGTSWAQLSEIFQMFGYVPKAPF